ncbi:MAG: 23S rRNA (adenine(2503)-C(2))-methyltransferase RlmN [Clostridia bacterium]|nr:23S rRNA (adenine(2503)-C(2))-methyltransferase RlmN [Clostridia bacterium]
MLNIFDYTIEELEDVLQPKFRAKQVYKWLYGDLQNRAFSFDDMSNLPKDMREDLKNMYELKYPDILAHQISKLDGTEKFLFGFDGIAIEAVYMKYKYGNSLCISSQAGCRMSCSFCASTLNGLVRNLSSGEMMAQVLAAERATNSKINHIVIMGTGEPFDNYEELVRFCRLINSKDGFNLSMRNITVSTCGLVPYIKRFSKDLPQVNLAISLHSADDKIRSQMMPVNFKYGVDELLQACKDYVDTTGRRISFEYTLCSGINDSDEDAKLLASKLFGLNCHVNLIPLNEVDETGLKTVNRGRAKEFMSFLTDRHIQCTLRRELGDDIDGACGQLRLKQINK